MEHEPWALSLPCPREALRISLSLATQGPSLGIQKSILPTLRDKCPQTGEKTEPLSALYIQRIRERQLHPSDLPNPDRETPWDASTKGLLCNVADSAVRDSRVRPDRGRLHRPVSPPPKALRLTGKHHFIVSFVDSSLFM
jgi:hypothetical protein